MSALLDYGLPPLMVSVELPFGYRATFIFDGSGLRCEWWPGNPAIHSSRARRRFIAAYATARNEFLRDVATVLGGTVVLIQVDGPTTPQLIAIDPGTRQ